MKEEFLDLVDSNDILIGKILRKEAHTNNKNIHREVAIFLFNSKGEILLSQRSQKKKVAPGWWDISAAGHVSYSEDPLLCAQRELREELGASIPLKFFTKYFDTNERESRFFYCYYAFTDLTDFNYDKDEVSEIRWVKVDELENFSKNNLYSKEYWSHSMISTIYNTISKR